MGFKKGHKMGVGRIYSAESRKKMSDSHIGKPSPFKGIKRKPLSKEHRKKISIAGMGRVVSEKTKDKIRLQKGWKHTEETKKIMSLKKIGKRSNAWKGGITPYRKAIRFSLQYKNWRTQVFLRDSFTCQKCGTVGGDIQVHHRYKSFSKLLQEVLENLPLMNLYDGAMLYSPLWSVENGVTLCKSCHYKTRIKGDKRWR